MGLYKTDAVNGIAGFYRRAVRTGSTARLFNYRYAHRSATGAVNGTAESIALLPD